MITKQQINEKYGNLREFCRSANIDYYTAVDCLRGKSKINEGRMIEAFRTVEPANSKFTAADLDRMQVNLFKNYRTQTAFTKANPQFSSNFVNKVITGKCKWWSPRIIRMANAVC